MKKTYNPLQDTKYMSPRMKKHFEKLLKQQLTEIRKQEILLQMRLKEHHDAESDILDQGQLLAML
jgi:hypothetical protein